MSGDVPVAPGGWQTSPPRVRPHPVLDRSRRLVFAHRGGAALRPENTLAAFDHAVHLGVDGLELDVQMSRDGELVVIHDFAVDRTTDGTGSVAELTWTELAQLDAGHRFSDEDGRWPYRGAGLRLVRLDDVLERYRDTPLIVELKGASTDLAKAAVEKVRRAGALDRVCFGGFHDVTLRAARECGGDVVTSGAREDIRRALWASLVGMAPPRSGYQAFQVPERHGDRPVVTPRFLRAAIRGGIPVQVWTVNDSASMYRLLEWGAQGIITDRPDVAVPLVKYFNEHIVDTFS
ncbi:MAG: glycerophosphodiester phosphodiesterase [Vicinamibacterales bacterium]